jgi:hypothetical protein
MTDVAISQIFLKLDAVLKESYGLGRGLAEPLSGPNIKGASPASALSWIVEGSQREDDLEPIPRLLAHFHNPLYPLGQAGLGVFIGSPFEVRFSSSVTWSQLQAGFQYASAGLDGPADSTNCPRILGVGADSNMSWRDARRYLQCALIAPTAADREAGFAAAFDAVGHVMHLIQDASVPAHVRNDPHVGLISAMTAAQLPQPIGDIFDPDGFHIWLDQAENRDRIRSWAPGALLLDNANALLNIPGPENTLPISNLFDADRYRGGNPDANDPTGVAEFSNSHSFSDDTISTVDHPRPLRSNLMPLIEPGDGGGYFSLFPDGAGPDTAPILKHLFRCGVFANKTLNATIDGCGLDDVVYADYAAQLVPRAIAYSEAAVGYFFRGSFDVSIIGTTLTIENTSAEDMNGEFSVYYDATDGLRYRVTASGSTSISSGAKTAPLPFVAPTDPAPAKPGEYTVVFSGRLGNEDGAIVGSRAKATTQATELFYIRPYVIAQRPAAIEKVGAGIVVDGLGYTSGLAADASGNLYFGELLFGGDGESRFTYGVHLFKRNPNGTITDLGSVFDNDSGTSGGQPDAYGFDIIASPSGEVFYNTPAVVTTTCSPSGSCVNTVIRHGTIQTLGGGPVVDGLGSPSGLAVDAAGNLYFGDVTPERPVRVQLKKRSADGTVTNLGTVFDASGGDFGISAFDVVASPSGEVFYITPPVFKQTCNPLCENNMIRPGTIQKLGGGTVVDGLASPSGLAVDADGNLYYGNVTFIDRLRVQLSKRSPNGTITSLGNVVETPPGPVGMPGFDIVATTHSSDTTTWTGLVANGDGAFINAPGCGTSGGPLSVDLTMTVVQMGDSVTGVTKSTVTAAPNCPDGVGFSSEVPFTGTATGSLATGSGTITAAFASGAGTGTFNGTFAGGRMSGTVNYPDGAAGTFAVNRR